MYIFSYNSVGLQYFCSLTDDVKSCLGLNFLFSYTITGKLAVYKLNYRKGLMHIEQTRGIKCKTSLGGVDPPPCFYASQVDLGSKYAISEFFLGGGGRGIVTIT